MNKNQKFLKKLHPKVRFRVIDVIALITAGNISNLDVKKIEDSDNLYRVRIGRVRIVYSKTENAEGRVISVGPRNENTYR